MVLPPELALALVVVALVALLGRLTLIRRRERAAAAEALQSLGLEMRRYAQAVSSTDNMVILGGPDGRVAWVNDAVERRTHYSREALVDRPVGEVLYAAQEENQKAAEDPRLREAIRAGTSFRDEVRLRSRSGETIWVVVDVSPVFDEDGELSGFVAVGADVTEARHNAELLRQAKEAAEQTALGKATFLATMSHEIRTPLNAVLGLTELLLLTELDDTQRDYVRTAQSSGRLLLALLNDVLDFSALETVRIETEGRAFALRPVLEETLTMFRADAERKGIALYLDVADEVPAFVSGDETRIRQVLVNLVGNGMKFTERGGVRVSISTETEHLVDGGLRLTVRDSGVGIPPERIRRLFEPFTQGDASTSRKYGGTGLGLAICQLVVARMGGRIWVTSDPGIGSCFYIELPLLAADPTSQPSDPSDAVAPATPRAQVVAPPPSAVPESAGETAQAPAAGTGSPAVLMAEDDPINQKVALAMLRRLGVAADVVPDGRAAVEAATSRPYGLVLMDIHMPEMDGIEAMRAIRAALPPERCPRIVAVTANALDGDREELLAVGMDDYVGKPVSLDDLRRVLERPSEPAPSRSQEQPQGRRAAARDESEVPVVAGAGKRAARV